MYYYQSMHQEPRDEKNCEAADYDEVSSAAYTMLPYEILEEVLTEAWLSEMSAIDRAHFISSISLVSKIWLITFSRVSSRDIYIISSSCLQHYLCLLDGGTSLCKWRNLPDTSPAELCRSITCQLSLSQKLDGHPRLVSQLTNLRPGKPMRDMLSTFRLLPCLPNLHSLSVAYHATTAEGTIQQAFHFPLTQLNLEYAISTDVDVWLIDELGLSGRNTRWSKQRHVPWSLPDLEHVSTTPDAPSTVIGKFLHRCPHLELEENERVQIKVRVLSSSRQLPQDCTIVHGVMAPSGHRSMSPMDGSVAKGVRGRALGIVIDSATNQRKNYNVANSAGWRSVHILAQRRSR